MVSKDVKPMNLEEQEIMDGFLLSTQYLEEAKQIPLEILEKGGVKLYSLRKNPRQDMDGNEVSKCFAVFCIDDRNVGTPHKWLDGCNRPHVDWRAVDKIMSPILQHISDTLNKVKL